MKKLQNTKLLLVKNTKLLLVKKFIDAPAMLLFALQNPLFPAMHTQTNLLNIFPNFHQKSTRSPIKID